MYKSPQWLTDNEFQNKKTKVVIIGAGGTGSELISQIFKINYTLMELGSAGLDVTLIDDDVVSASNIGRQSFYNFDIAQPKAKTLVDRFNTFGNLTWKYVVKRITPENIAKYIPNNCVVFTCVDNPIARVTVGEHLEKRLNSEVLWIDGGNSRADGQVVFGSYEQRKDLPYSRLPSVFDLYGEQLKTQEYIATESCSHLEAMRSQTLGINNAIALQMTQLFWQLVREGEITAHGAIVDLKSFTVNALPIDPEIWTMFGFTDKRT
ncbi:PRTRC system ThiF family protein [Pseudoalteromonas sp. APC 3358]|uniref:PRTRC system ThiF family protein n=1 Tax=unclassified Pseudoalteromonas TaxID=194690 RepID=UPI000428DD24|nr:MULTISPECIES: PRTRC system ThiF family protein [unclassified Pseudoalteromonas]MDN3384469.1 PRTRC system ThiF family protein [Pseudoalteromonas sp. APC 3358]|tara:strand:- start:212 stop:1003 length:792 start_codon:yes stop_codon:yes gene_type:complete